MRNRNEHSTFNAQRSTLNVQNATTNENRGVLRVKSWKLNVGRFLLLTLLLLVQRLPAETLLFQNAIVHTVSGETLTNGRVLVVNDKIAEISSGSTRSRVPRDTKTIDV